MNMCDRCKKDHDCYEESWNVSASESECKNTVIQHMSYNDWCKKERLPQDEISRAVYRHWKMSIPKLQGIIDNIMAGNLSQAHEDLGKYIVAFRPERFTTV